jgi:hypothetical protein
MHFNFFPIFNSLSLSLSLSHSSFLYLFFGLFLSLFLFFFLSLSASLFLSLCFSLSTFLSLTLRLWLFALPVLHYSLFLSTESTSGTHASTHTFSCMWVALVFFLKFEAHRWKNTLHDFFRFIIIFAKNCTLCERANFEFPWIEFHDWQRNIFEQCLFRIYVCMYLGLRTLSAST